MRITRIRRTGPAAAVAAIVAVSVAACGTAGDAGTPTGGSGSARALLRATLQGGHAIHSGVLSLRATLTPQGTGASSTPMTLSFGGPFEQRDAGQGTESDFTVALAVDGQRLSFGLRTTSSAAFMQLAGTWYRLPAEQFAQLRKSLGSLGAGSGALPGLSVTPLRWLSDPQVVGDATVDGVAATEVRARLNVAAFAGDLAGLLAKQSSNPALKRSGVPTTITPAQRRQLVAALQHPWVDVFIGRHDRLLRRATLDVGVKVPPEQASRLGGVDSLAATVAVDYGQLNQPQTITAPSKVKPYRALSRQLLGLGSSLTGGTGSSTSSGSGAAGASGAGSGAGTGTAKYEACLQRAAGDMAKLQKCASLIDGSNR